MICLVHKVFIKAKASLCIGKFQGRVSYQEPQI